MQALRAQWEQSSQPDTLFSLVCPATFDSDSQTSVSSDDDQLVFPMTVLIPTSSAARLAKSRRPAVTEQLLNVKAKIIEEEDKEGPIEYRSLTNRDLFLLWGVAFMWTELRIRRLQLWETMSRDVVPHMAVLAGCFLQNA